MAVTILDILVNIFAFVDLPEEMSTVMRIILILIGLSLLAGCNNEPTPAPMTEATPATVAVATPGLLLLTPLPPVPEEPLESALVNVPEVIIVSGRQSLDTLASYFKTTPEQLRWTNPDLTDPVLPGTLVIIPAVYRTAEGETLSAIAETTGIPEQLLSAANPNLTQDETLAAGAILAVPPLYIADDETSVNAVAEQLGAKPDQLLSANPDLSADDSIRPGTVLFAPLPLQREEP